VPLVLLERSWWEGFNGIYLVGFGFRMWEILIFKWFLPLKIQINSKKTRFWKQESVDNVRGNTWATWNFIFSLPPTEFFFFFFCFWNFSRPPTYYPTPLSPSNLLAYVFKLKLDSSPSTYSPINLKCVTLISTHLCTPPPPPQSIYLPTCPSTFLPTNTLRRYLPNPTYMATPTYMVATPINLEWLTTMKKT
jgi:hypothetical protein